MRSLGTAPSNRRLAEEPLSPDTTRRQEAADGGAAPNDWLTLVSSGVRPDPPHPRLLADPVIGPATREAMKAHRAWAKIHAPWLLEEWD